MTVNDDEPLERRNCCPQHQEVVIRQPLLRSTKRRSKSKSKKKKSKEDDLVTVPSYRHLVDAIKSAIVVIESNQGNRGIISIIIIIVTIIIVVILFFVVVVDGGFIKPSRGGNIDDRIPSSSGRIVVVIAMGHRTRRYGARALAIQIVR